MSKLTPFQAQELRRLQAIEDAGKLHPNAPANVTPINDAARKRRVAERIAKFDEAIAQAVIDMRPAIRRLCEQARYNTRGPMINPREAFAAVEDGLGKIKSLWLSWCGNGSIEKYDPGDGTYDPLNDQALASLIYLAQMALAGHARAAGWQFRLEFDQ